jgi:hypothetical protein
VEKSFGNTLNVYVSSGTQNTFLSVKIRYIFPYLSSVDYTDFSTMTADLKKQYQISLSEWAA